MVTHRLRHRVATAADGSRAVGWYALCSVVAFGAAAAAFVAISPLGGSVHTVEVASGTTSLRVAGALVPVSLGYVGMGMARLYLTALPALLLLAGSLGGVASPRGGSAFAAACGVAAAATVTVVLGCPCGTGSATPLVLKAL